ncbi:uncharacterized protein LOC132296096 [Cornus florida]|uniref:uncharacterized protein LOC132296096 n=1 Tax=Cornus florida TaxID=4283 RepID=UPI0028970B7D|nr:uncharacterized protein LOC132296096 [Cornus florida]
MSPPAPPSYISATAASATAVNARAATPPSSPKSLSPKMEPVSTPPSPLFLPPAQIKFVGKPETKIPAEAEKKTILVQETFNTSNGNFQKHASRYSDSEDFGVRVITIAGENRGAIMELSPSLCNEGNPTALNNNGEKLERESNEEGRSKMKDKTHKMVWPLKTTFMNSNVQGASNSILLDCSFTHHGPGVHHSLSGKANGGRGAQLND